MYSVCDLGASCLLPHKANPDTVPTNQAEGVWSACCLCGLPLFGTVGTFWYHLLFYSIVFAAAKMESLGQRDGLNFRIFLWMFPNYAHKIVTEYPDSRCMRMLAHATFSYPPNTEHYFSPSLV